MPVFLPYNHVLGGLGPFMAFISALTSASKVLPVPQKLIMRPLDTWKHKTICHLCCNNQLIMQWGDQQWRKWEWGKWGGAP